MAPEAIHGEAEPASDVYSVGIVLYELVTGAPPYGGEPLAVLRRHVEESVERPPAMPHPVWSLIEWCLDKDPARRPTAGELGSALRDLARQTAGIPALTSTTLHPDFAYGETAALGRPHPSERRRPVRRRPRNGPKSWMWRRPGMMLALLASAVAVSGLGGYNAWRLIGGGHPPDTIAERLRPTLPTVTGVAPSAPAAAADLAQQIPSRVAGEQSGSVVTTAPRSGTDLKAEAAAGPAKIGAKLHFGPWRCGDAYSWDLGHPVLARPCQATGPAIRVMGQMEAAPGVQADISLTVRDAASDEVVAGPYTCTGLMFTDFALKHACGPADLTAPHGHRYVLVETWQYTERPLLPPGSAQGPEFDW
jgi:serine/threonine-protein kinase